MSVPGFFAAITGAASAGRGFDMADDVRKYGKSLYNYTNGVATGAMPELGNQLADGSKFQGYGVSSGLGNTTIGTGPNGTPQVDLGVGQNQAYNGYANNYMNAANSFMNQSMVDPAARQQQLYEQNMAVQNPMLNQMQAQQSADDFAMGRHGVSGSQFGGSSGDAAMARARVQGSNQAYQMAQQQGLAEQAQQAGMASQYGQMGQSAYQTSFLPMQQQMQLMQLAGADADRYQTGQLTGQGYLGQLNLGGIQAGVNSMKAASELEGNIYDSIFDNVGGLLTGIFD
jgi:hypothetical protein